MYDTIIKGGRVATASDVFTCDIAIRDGKIVALGTDLGEARDVIDAGGRWVLPGGIDSHVHISQPSGEGIVMADDFESATRSAAMGGNTTILPFCLQESGQSLRTAIENYHAKAEGQCYTDVSFHMIISDPSPQVLGQELPALVRDGYTSFKIFMTYDGLALGDLDILRVMAVAKDTRALVMIHAENYDIIRYLTEQFETEGKTAPKYHASSRPKIAEREATYRAISLAELSDVPLMVVHVSNRETMEEIRRARQRGLRIYGETCPQYLVLTENDLDGLNMEGAKYVCSPPPRDVDSQEACWEGLQQDVFSVFSSDHCPFRYDDSQGKLTPKGRTSFRWVPNGIPGVGARLPILFSEGVMKGRIDINRFVAVTSTNHAKAYGLYPRKGTIAIGADADIAIWDPEIRQVLTHSMLDDGSDYTPYEGLELTGWPILTMVRGKVVVCEGKLSADKGVGTYLPREISSYA
ncbi:dihydropyrimidinase [Agrobacterium pusense]|uniref:D-hydantoinase (Dihydropyrimidinase) (DHPase) n=5 Tax=Bacteria TaxID=2 RepID=A0A9W5F154_9HYPH|nr:dihydropyrimidinase [Agrobacterium pusense]OJH55865.1 dihydropyrimidinase [Agrobacterium pusense]CAD7035202.1 dihydropyrimidinase [Rhizobium sp. P007]CUW96643.1 D-hydantoinase (Dihydropyrimidinase) (DHPase) [Agrobacterium genomosp. 2 str. CFBP 5494]